MKTVKISKKADFKIRMKLMWMQWKKNFGAIQALQVVLPALLIGVVVFGVINIGKTDQNGGALIDTPSVNSESLASTNASDIFREARNDKYRNLAKRRAYAQKAERYKQYSYVRIASLRSE